MEKIEKKNIKEICRLIDQKIEGSVKRNDNSYIYIYLMEALAGKLSYDDIVLICEKAVEIAKTRNRGIRHLEKYYWKFINNVPLKILFIHKPNIAENEELLSNTDYDDTDKKILSRLLGLAQEILEIKDDHSKASDLRRSSSLRIVADLFDWYHIPFAKKLFVESINSKNQEEQYTALEGLERYFSISDDVPEDDLIQQLKRIKDETDERCVASTCLQILLNAGLIDEMTAVLEMDDWDDDPFDYDIDE